MVLSLSARGLTHGEISAYLAEVYGAEVSKTTITTITDRVVDGMTEWQNRPMDPGQSPETGPATPPTTAAGHARPTSPDPPTMITRESYSESSNIRLRQNTPISP